MSEEKGGAQLMAEGVRTKPIDAGILPLLLRLDEATGRLFWRERGVEWFLGSPRRAAAHACALWNARYAGKEAFTTTTKAGYRQGAIFDHLYYAHIIVFAIHHGRWPSLQVDHRDTDTLNNRPSNLREATNQQNQQNRGAYRGGTSRYCGVSWDKRRKKWRARGQDKTGVGRWLGYFADEIAAANAYDAFVREAHGEFAHLNLPAGESA